MSANRTHLDQLLRRRLRNSRVPAIVTAWSEIGVSVSPLSADRQAEVVSYLRAAGFRSSPIFPSRSVEPLSSSIIEIAKCSDMLAIIGWEVDEEPAILLPPEALHRAIPHLRSIYPDGFVLIDQPPTSALIVDFDDEYPSAVYIDRLFLGVGR